MRRAPWLLLPLLAAGCMASPEPGDASPSPTASDQPSIAAGNWTTRPALPTPRTELACAVAGGKLYALGGFNAQAAPIGLLEAYDLATTTWTRAADYPIAVHHLGLVAHKGALYAFGGHTGTQVFVATNAAFRYDPATNAWTPETTLPRARGAFAIVLFGDEAYLVGGTDSQRPGSSIYAVTDVYNLTTKTWRVGPALAEPREHFAGAAAQGVVVVAGGRMLTLGSNVGTTDSLQAGATSWTREPKMPSARGGIAAASWADTVVVFGGEHSSGTHDEAEGFNVTSRRWVEYAPMPSARHGLCAAAAPDGLHVVGGGPQPAYTVSGQHEVLLPGVSTSSSG
ncbi:MAG: hypothetical protein HYT80_01600 [Euryarchaeota archaeon]|nr:hypothetical protein [Euryarchaeota archaeon]